MTAPAARWSDTTIVGLPAADLVLSVALLVAAVTTTFQIGQPEGPLAVTLPCAIAMSIALAWRSRAPLSALVVILLASQVQSILAESPGTLWSLVVYLVAAYSIARLCPEGKAAVGGFLLVSVLLLQDYTDGSGDYVFAIVVFGGAWLLGRAVRHWQERATVAEQNQELLARSAVAEERVRIARELHDMVAHSISVIAVQANAAEAALDHDPSLARKPLGTIKSSSRQALEEMRRLLVLLRADDEQVPPRPQPGMADLEKLTGSLRGVGLIVDVRVRGDAAELPAGVDMSAYRIIQEALTNVLKHAGRMRATVEVDYEPGCLTLRVSNDVGSVPTGVRGTPGTGQGLVGIRERVALLGGDLQVGADDRGKYVVRARLPLPATP